MVIDDLLTYLFNGQPHHLAAPMAAWLESRRFAAFVTTYQNKIRKKIRLAHDPDTLLDLRLELETAYLLLGERTLHVVYEPQQPGNARSPDFEVSFTTSTTFMVEATRMRSEQNGNSHLATMPAQDYIPLFANRVADVVAGKLGQLLPHRSNVLVVGVETLPLTSDDLRSAILRLQQRAEQNDPTLLRWHRFRDRADFFQQYQRLSEVVVRGQDRQLTFVNGRAKNPLPAKIRTIVQRCLG